MLEELKTADKVVGINQLRKALKNGSAAKAFLAEDADPRLIDPLRESCEQSGVPVVMVPTMAEIGKACGIEIRAAAAAILR